MTIQGAWLPSFGRAMRLAAWFVDRHGYSVKIARAATQSAGFK